MEDENFLSKISKFASDALFGPSAEAAQFYASKEGKVPSDIPLKFTKTSLADVLGSEPSTGKEFKDLIAKEFLNRVAENNKIKNPKERKTTGTILNELDQDLLQAAAVKLGVKKLQDIPEKFLTAYGISPEEQKKFNQIYLQHEKKVEPGRAFSVEGFTFPTFPNEGTEPLGTGIEGIPYSSKDKVKAQDYKTWGLPVSTEGELKPKEFWPLSKITSYPGQETTSATTMAHELLHSVNQYKHPKEKTTDSQDFSKNLKDVDINQALKQLGFMSHFSPSKMEGEETYGLHGQIANIFHPEWFNPNAKPSSTPAINQQPTPIPTPTPTPKPTPTPIPEDWVPEPEPIEEESDISKPESEFLRQMKEISKNSDTRFFPEESPKPVKFQRTKTKTSKKK